jgi:hypothetical protein
MKVLTAGDGPSRAPVSYSGGVARPKLGNVVNWLGRAVRGVSGGGRRREDAAKNRVPKIRPRSSSSIASTKVDLHELTPDVTTFLGKAAYLQLMMFENLSRVVSTAPTTEAKATLTEAAGFALDKYHGLTEQIERHGADPAAIMEPFTNEVDGFQRLTQGHDWYESVMTCYLSAGFLNDFFVRLAVGLAPAASGQVTAVLSGDSGEALLARELLAVIETNPRMAARLALWGRRLVGDTMLIARWTLRTSENHDSDEARIEPVFTELIAAHTRRMDALGLTA